jgi:YVTN family beta-propeller protein
VAVIVTGARRVSTPIPVGHVPHGVAVSPDSVHVYVANSGDGTLSVIDTRPNGLARTIPVGANAVNPLAAPNGSTVYVTAGGGIVVVNVLTAPSPARSAHAARQSVPSHRTARLTRDSLVTVDTATNMITGTAKLGLRNWSDLAVLT